MIKIALWLAMVVLLDANIISASAACKACGNQWCVVFNGGPFKNTQLPPADNIALLSGECSTNYSQTYAIRCTKQAQQCGIIVGTTYDQWSISFRDQAFSDTQNGKVYLEKLNQPFQIQKSQLNKTFYEQYCQPCTGQQPFMGTTLLIILMFFLGCIVLSCCGAYCLRNCTKDSGTGQCLTTTSLK